MLPAGFTFDPGWAVLLRDLGVDHTKVLARAGIPAHTLGPEGIKLPASTMFSLWRALEHETGDPMLPLRLAEGMTTESFFAALATALSSQNLVTATQRLADYEGLVGPIRFAVDADAEGTTISVDGGAAAADCPPGLLL